MCFVLYIGTNSPLPLRKWEKADPGLCVASLTDRDSSIRAHFTAPQVQYLGSTSGCGCDFAYVNLQNGEWPIFDFGENEETLATYCRNRRDLVDLLRSTGEKTVEFYGVWDGDFAEVPQASEEIALEQILDLDFRFKERGFYRVLI